MEKIYSTDNDKQLIGYNERWYSSSNQLKSVMGVRVAEDTLDIAQALSTIYGIELINHNIREFKYHLPTWVGAYDVDAFLVSGTYVVLHKLKDPKNREADKKTGIDKAVSKSAPVRAITIFSNSKDAMVAAAHKLKLPLESLVEDIGSERKAK